jgi:hypothetical protein
MFALKKVGVPVTDPAEMAAGVGPAFEGGENAAGTDQQHSNQCEGIRPIVPNDPTDQTGENHHGIVERRDAAGFGIAIREDNE